VLQRYIYKVMRLKIILFSFIYLSINISIHAQEFQDLKSIVPVVKTDYINFYSKNRFINIGISTSVAAVVAHTAIDRNLNDWYQNEIRTNASNDIAMVAKFFGEGKYLIPISLLSASSGLFLDDEHDLSWIAIWGRQTSRAYLVGAPLTLLMQRFIGSSRPGEHSHHAEWRPLRDDNGVSGHAFIGAVPFLVAKNMVDNKLTAPLFYLLSGMTAWSRINDNKHYVSQAFLGWFIAYQATSAVNENHSNRKFSLIPIRNGIAVVILIEY